MTNQTEHDERYFGLLEKDNTNPTDLERKSLFYILANADIFSKVDYIYDFNTHWIKTDYFEKTDFSSSSKKMVELAFNLYNGNPSPDPLRIFSGLDDDNFQICLNAILIRFSRFDALEK